MNDVELLFAPADLLLGAPLPSVVLRQRQGLSPHKYIRFTIIDRKLLFTPHGVPSLVSQKSFVMSNNNGSSHPTNDTEQLVNEQSCLLETSSDTTASSRNSNNNDPDLLFRELERPWPSTYERSITLLASPILPRDKADLYTKSPKPGSSPAVLARRSNFDRGVYTPELNGGDGGLFASLKRRLSEHDAQPITKIVSSSLTKLDVEAIVDLQNQKRVSAAQYRAEILKQQQQQQTTKSTRKSTRKSNRKIEQKATTLQCGFNLANILMGVGLLGLPYVFKTAGWYGGILSILVFGFITWRTSILIGRELNGDPRPCSYFDDSPYASPLLPGSARGRMLPPLSGFPDIATSAFGHTGTVLLSVILYFELFSCVSIFFVSMGDHLHQLFDNLPAQTAMIIVAALSLFPTIILRTPTLLSYLSMVGTFATVAVVSSVIASAISEGDITDRITGDDTTSHHSYWKPEGLSLAFGLVAYCFSGHAIVPSIYTSMEKPQEFERMVTITFLIVIFCCLAVASAGYFMFGDVVLDQVTLSLESNSSAVLAMKCLTWLMILTAYSKTTLTMFPLALGLEEIIAPYLMSERMVEMSSSVIKFTVTFLALLVSIGFPSFSYLCALVGMICTMTVSVVFPAAAHYKLFGSRLNGVQKSLDVAFVIAGLVMAVVGTIAVV